MLRPATHLSQACAGRAIAVGGDPLAQLAALALYAQGHAKFRPRAGGHGQRGMRRRVSRSRWSTNADRYHRRADAARQSSAARRRPHIGYWLGRRYWGHGYMTAALRGVVDHVFCVQPHDAIYCGAFVGNCASIGEQGEERLVVRLAHETQGQPRRLGLDPSPGQAHVPLLTLPQLLSEAHSPRSRRKRSTGADEASARMR